MFYTAPNRIKLVSRNEGKLKSYDSCIDVRAWSHDGYKRNAYLRDWIKCDMPVCVVPVYTVASLLGSMTRKRRGRNTPRCHPECRSKVILNSIYTSCHAINECLRTEGEFHKIFVEEEFETSHWPCERCLEILKSIKLFWKIILEKLFKISVPTNKDFKCSRSESISDFAKEWQNDIVKQALMVKNLTPILSNHFGMNLKEDKNNRTMKENNKTTKDPTGHYLTKSHKKRKDKATSTDFITNIDKIEQVALFSKHSSACVEKTDVSCNTYPIKNAYLSRSDLIYLQQRLNVQYTELKRLKDENNSLKLKLKHEANNNSSSYACNAMLDGNMVLKPFEDCCEEKSELIKDIESEMIITLKNCENKNFRHVSILQVLHKSNGIITNEKVNENCYCFNKRNPIDILTRVHDTFGAIVKREINIAKANNNCHINDIKCSFHQVESIPSCGKTNSTATASKYVSATQVQ